MTPGHHSDISKTQKRLVVINIYYDQYDISTALYHSKILNSDIMESIYKNFIRNLNFFEIFD